MLYFNLLHVESKLQLFYHNADTASTLTFNINESTIKYNHYEQDYSAAAPLLAQQLEGDSLAGEQKLYLQAMAGTKVNLRIPNIGSIPGKEKIAINEALLVFTNAEPQSILAPPLQLSLRLYVDSEKYVIFPEENYNALYFGGRYRNNGEYQFRITKYVQERIMYPEMPDYGMVLLVSGAALSSNRLVLYGPGSDTSAVKLKIYYSMNGL